MLTVLQTNFNGIDGLELTSQPIPQLTENGVLIKMDILPVVPTDWKLESNPNATNEQQAQLPKVIGIGGTGQIVKVGKNRNQSLLNQRVLVMNPAGSYSEYVLSENPEFIFLLPKNVSNQSAAALTAGPGIANVLKREIEQNTATNIVITGANSVIGMYLLQMLTNDTRKIWPIVSPASQAYFHTQFPQLTSYTTDELPKISDTSLIIDIAGSISLLDILTSKFINSSVTSIALMDYSNANAFKFVHEDFDANLYQTFIKQLASGELWTPINKIFPIEQVKAAQHYAKDNHSRGRVLVSFNH